MLSTQNAGVSEQNFSGVVYRYHGKYRKKTLRKTESEGSDIAHCTSETLRVSTPIAARKIATSLKYNNFNASPPSSTTWRAKFQRESIYVISYNHEQYKGLRSILLSKVQQLDVKARKAI